MKIPVQDKIAELEARIAALEKRSNSERTRTLVQVVNKSVLGEHWDKMWLEFDHAMKAAFRRWE